jgi:hypothetical protein
MRLRTSRSGSRCQYSQDRCGKRRPDIERAADKGSCTVIGYLTSQYHWRGRERKPGPDHKGSALFTQRKADEGGVSWVWKSNMPNVMLSPPSFTTTLWNLPSSAMPAFHCAKVSAAALAVRQGPPRRGTPGIEPAEDAQPQHEAPPCLPHRGVDRPGRHAPHRMGGCRTPRPG